MAAVDREMLLQWAFGMSEAGADRDSIRAVIEGCDSINLPKRLIDDEAEEDILKDETNLFAIIDELTIPEKIKLALFGNQTARALLLRDHANKQIPLLVLQNPRITDTEIVEIAKNPNMDERVLRAIGLDPNRMKAYALKIAIASNPRVPLDVSLKWLKHLRDRDLRVLARSKNVPQVISTQSRKLLDKRTER
jgi:hypothetical protein